MAPSNIPSYEEISEAEFHEILKQYPGLIETLSKSKPAKSGQKTLQELDEFRFVSAPKTFGGPAPKQSMKQQDVETLVRWKLRHSKFRPTLMSLVSSNPPGLTSRTIASALQTYRRRCASGPPATDAIVAALGALAKLRGIGPATASLLLAVHDAPNVAFFSDEAFQWLCPDGAAAGKMRYDVAEYRGLCERARALARRLGVTPVEIEKVAYVLVRHQQQQQQQQQHEGEDEMP
ncbi:hypothetical protein ESCO_000304 [Escovopsis weberi]|uniref:Uncharacterized protein n=1 Tax=Escovopsis weberi TaxID=150374 RepID=A0A0M8MWS7_ESCWE|nr:hypothetical protein ESCO_000304 [Escovopsis weberi]